MNPYKQEQAMIDKFLSVPEAVEMGLAQSTIYHNIKHGKLKVFPRGTIKMILRREVLALIKKKK